jgi:ubiquinone/menaquinone biosynthesis C-methylase UbiE
MISRVHTAAEATGAMSEPSLQTLTDAAAVYEELFVPGMFGEWADLVADAADVGRGQRVLDVACGTGALARAVAARVGPGGSVTGLDLNPGMLSVAARIAPGITWQQGSAEALPFGDRSFDAVVSQFGLMFFTDRRAALQQMLRVMVPGGRLAVAVWGSLDDNPAYAAMDDLFRVHAGAKAAEALQLPFSLGDPNELRALFADAGISSARVTTHEGTVRFSDIRSMVRADVEGWFPVAGITLDKKEFEELVAEACRALKPYLAADGTVEFPMPVHIVTATKT